MNKTNKLTGGRNGTIDFLRFVFSLFVAALHFNGVVDYPNERFQGAYFSVEFFFLVSGFLFAKSMKKYDENESDAWEVGVSFIKKKYLSVFSYQIIAVILVAADRLFLYYDGFKSLISKICNAFPSVFYLQMLGAPEDSRFYHEWYISAMLLVMMILAPLMLKHRKALMYAAPAVSIWTYCYLHHSLGTIETQKDWLGFLYSGNFRALAGILMGCVCYELLSKGIFDKANRYVLIITEIACYALVFAFASGNHDDKYELTLIFILALAVMISFSDKGRIDFLDNKISFFLGKISLPLYICHVPLRYFAAKLGLKLGYYPDLIIFLISVTAFSVLSYLIVSRISEKRKSNKPKRRKN